MSAKTPPLFLFLSRWVLMRTGTKSRRTGYYSRFVGKSPKAYFPIESFVRWLSTRFLRTNSLRKNWHSDGVASYHEGRPSPVGGAVNDRHCAGTCTLVVLADRAGGRAAAAGTNERRVRSAVRCSDRQAKQQRVRARGPRRPLSLAACARHLRFDSWVSWRGPAEERVGPLFV